MKNPTPTYSFQQFNEEINDLYKYLKDNKYTDEEIRKIFAPLKPDTQRIKFVGASVLALLCLVTALYFATYIETLSWHFSALGRILLIKLLPFWDWTSLKNSKCLIERPTSATAHEATFNCDLCESIREVDVFEDIGTDLLKKRYVDVDVPVIVRRSWARSDTLVDDLTEDPQIGTSKPCALSTNVHGGVPTVRTLLQATQIFDSFFLHFQNCEFGAVKQFRRFAPRPTFVPPELSPVQYNWLLWSKNYNVTQFKRIGLVEKVAVVGQISGGNLIRLLPRSNCEVECPAVEVLLKEGESIVFTSLWNLEYRPDFGENVAVILEMH